MRRNASPGATALVLVIALLITWPVDPAWAGSQRVAVISISGPGAKRVRRFLEQAIDERFVLVTYSRVQEAAEDLGIRRQYSRRSNLQRICRKAGIDAAVTGYVYRRRRRWWLTIQVRDGNTGRVVTTRMVNYRYFSLNSFTKKTILGGLVAGVNKVEGVPKLSRRRRAAADDDDDDDDEPRPRPRPKKKKPKKTWSGKRPPWVTGIRVAIGMELWIRQLVFKPANEKLYETDNPVPPMAIDLEVFPGAFASRHRVLANIGLGLQFRRAFGIVTFEAGNSEPIGTTIQRISGFLLYRWNVNRSMTSPELLFQLGVDVMEFSFGKDLAQVAGVQYISFAPGLRVSFPLGTERVRLSLGMIGLAVLQMGQIEDAWHYGNGSAGGVRAKFELDVRVGWKIHLVAGATTTWIFMSFPQRGLIHRDYEFEASGATDGYIGGYAMVTVDY